MKATVVSPSLCDLSHQELSDWCRSQGEAAYRADQIWRWLFSQRWNDFESMHDLPLDLRQKLSERFELFSSKVVRHQTASDRTEKLLLELHDGQRVECVLMRETSRRTICLSTQVGCGMGCVFCASGLQGLDRNLSTGEILEQALRLDRLLPAERRITNVVVMGMGEPLANLPALLPALETLNGKRGLGLGARRITISTVGLPEKMRELATFGKPFKLAVSLHAPNDELRNQLVPVNEHIGLEAILDAADDYFGRTGRRVSYEYVLLDQRNAAADHAHQLATLLKGRNAHINVIPMNDIEELAFRSPSAITTNRFVRILEDAGLAVTVRKRKGADIDAACGQLALREATYSPPSPRVAPRGTPDA